jgi:hypothetical protein
MKHPDDHKQATATSSVGSIKKMSGMFSVVAMTEITAYWGKIPVFFPFSGCVHPGQNFVT